MNSEFTAFYRKHRPGSFKDVIGQDHIVKVLEESVKNNTFSHAYLFSGSRGIGKTSIARILAGEIGASVNDITEIDAASHRGIDDIRSLRDSVSSLPMESPFKVYVIDEVHMLTKEAFNALLKTLEEPPSHAIFILATTEFHKLPETIISRCQTFTFKKPTQKILKDVILSVSKKEGIKIDNEAAGLVALLAEGSFRDALGTLQKVASASSGEVKAGVVESITGAPSSSLVDNFIIAIKEKDEEKGLNVLNQVGEANMDMEIFLKRVLQRVRFILLLRFSSKMEGKIKEEISEEEFQFIKKLAEDKSFHFSSKELNILLNSLILMSSSHIPQFPLELAFLDIVGSGKSDSDVDKSTA